MIEFEADLSRLWGMLNELEPKRRKQALKAGFRKYSTQIRKTAIANLRASGLSSNRSVESGIRLVMWRRDKVGFRVTIGTKKKGKNAKNDSAAKRRRRLSIVPLWAEGGTVARATRRGYNRGSMPAYGFMAQTKSQTQSVSTDGLTEAMMESVEKAVTKYGGKFS